METMEIQKHNRVCLFIRVSRNHQEHERQARDLTSFCEQRGYVIAKTIASKISGTKTHADRPDLKELFAAAKKKIFDKVVVAEISRIGRNAKDIRATIDYLHSLSISIVFFNLNGMESLDANGKESFVANILIAVYAEAASEESRNLSARIRSGLSNARAKGKKIGRPEGSEDAADVLRKYPRLVRDLRSGISLNRCMLLNDVSKNTVIKIKKLLALQKQAA